MMTLVCYLFVICVFEGGKEFMMRLIMVCFGSCLAIGKTESEEIRERLLELSEQFGVDVVVYENEDEIEHEVAKDAVRNGDLVEA